MQKIILLPNQTKRFISNILKLLTAGSMIGALYFSARYADKRKLDQVLTCLENGTMPLVYDDQNCIDRKRDLSKLKKAILSPKATEGKSGLFFVIVGPSGCGKTMLMKQLCRQNPTGLIYYEVYDSKSFPVGLGRACGMSFEMQGNIWQTFVGWGNLPYKSWFVLPESPEAALSYVIEVLEKQGLKFRLKHGIIPTIVIDAVEIIAKTDLEFFKHLIRLSKRVVNEGSLNIVLVSSEGHVVPIVKSLAEKSRIKELYVEDISEKEALVVLTQGKLSEDVSRQLLAISGPRLQYLKRIQASAHLCGFPAVSGDALVKCIKCELTKEAQDCVRQARVHKASETYKIHRTIFECILKKEEESRATIEYEVCKQLKDEEKFDDIQTCIQDLLHANVLTLEDDRIKFHSRLVQTYIKKFLASNDEKPVEL